jgi:hypothetical protein
LVSKKDNKKEISIHQRRGFLGNKSIYLTDGAREELDGKADYISLDEGSRNLRLSRTDNYDRFKKEFDEADKILAESKERFKDYFK